MSHIRIVCCLIGLILTPFSSATVLFEGAFSIEKSGKKTGYLLQRVETRDKQTQITTFELTHNSASDANVIRWSRITPTGYQYHYISKAGHMKVTGLRQGQKLIVERSAEGQPHQKESIAWPMSGFFSSFLYQIAKPDSLSIGREYKFNAISEDRGQAGFGVLKVLAKKDFSGSAVFQIQDFFDGEGIENFVFADGHFAGARNSREDMVVYLVKDRLVATQGFDSAQKLVIQAFGDLPSGEKNPASVGKWDAKAKILALSAPKPFEPSELTSPAEFKPDLGPKEK